MDVLWTHNFNPAQPNSQVYMNTAARGLREQGVRLELEYLGNLRSPRNILRARGRVRELSRNFDVVHAQYGSACALASATAAAARVVSIRGNDWNVHTDTFGFFYVHTRLAVTMTRASIAAYDGVITVSRRLGEDVARTARHALMATLPSPVDLQRFVPLDKAEARARLGHAGSREKWVLFVALRPDDPIKRFALARQAVDLAQQARGDIRFRLASTLPHEEVPLLVAACDVLLCTSETEGWPNSVKEALACNVPFVSTDVSDLRDIAAVEPSCRVCAPDAAVLARHLCDVLSMPAPHDLRHHVRDMSIEAGGRQLFDLYNAVLARRQH